MGIYVKIITLMEETGVVKSIDGPRAVVSVVRKSSCEHCTAGTCHLSAEGAEIEAINQVAAQVGQRVRVELQSYSYVKGSIAFYGVPTVALIAGAVLGREFLSPLIPGIDPEGASAISAFVMFALSFFAVKLWGRRAGKSTGYQPVITEILK